MVYYLKKKGNSMKICFLYALLLLFTTQVFGAYTGNTPSFSTVQGGNIKIQTNSVISTNTNGDISLTPNGTGSVLVPTASLGDDTTKAASTAFVLANRAAGNPRLVRISRLTASGTFTRLNANVTRMEFYYCGGGGGGAGAKVTTAAETAPSTGGNSGQLRFCALTSPASTIAYTIGTGGTVNAGGSGNTGGSTTIIGCTNATGGTGSSIPATNLGSTSLSSRSPSCTGYSFISESNVVIGTCLASNVQRLWVSGVFQGASASRGGRISEVSPFLLSASGESGNLSTPLSPAAAGGDAPANSCGGGGGGISPPSNATGLVGGLGGSGQIIVYEYE
jgi:hypothetical protein